MTESEASASTPSVAVHTAPARRLEAPSRRTILVGAAWVAPAIAMTVGTPANAASNDTTMSLSAPGGEVPAAGGVTVTASVSRGGKPVAGAAVSFSGPSGSSFSPSVATTQGSGLATSIFDLGNSWTAPGSSAAVAAVTAGAVATSSFTVLGANVFRVGDDVSTAQQEALVFPSPVVATVASYDSMPVVNDTSKSFALALLKDGTVWSVGSNTYSQLGDGTTTSRSTWAKVAGVSGAVSIAAGGGISYAVLTDGSLLVWGKNDSGQAGVGAAIPIVSTPTAVPGLTTVTQVCGGSGFTYALLSDGTVQAWGYGKNGILGTGDETSRPSPTPVPGLTDVIQLSSGYGTGYALLADGTVRAWGFNEIGQVGDGTTTSKLSPTVVQGLSGVKIKAVAAGLSMAFALADNGTVYGWGRAVSSGNNKWTAQLTPALIDGLSGVTEISGQYCAGTALLSDGTVKAWGQAWKGAFGTGSDTLKNATSVPGLSGKRIEHLPVSSPFGQRHLYVVQIPTVVQLSVPNGQVPAAGAVTLTASVSKGADYVSGAVVSFSGPSGSSFSPSSATTQSTGLATSSFDLGNSWATPGSSAAVSATTSDATGAAAFTVLGANAMRAGGGVSSTFTQDELVFPSPVVEMVAATQIYASSDSNDTFRVALLQDGSVWAVGSNAYGQLGDGTAVARSTWKKIDGLSSITQISIGVGTCYALSQNNVAYSWGRNGNGQIGNGTDTTQLTPAVIPGLTDVVQVVAGGSAGFALLGDGTVRSWGYGTEGRLGNGDTQNQYSPVVVSGLSKVVSITAGRASGFALTQDGTLMSWGSNTGDPSVTVNLTPAVVPGLGQAVTAVATSHMTAYVILADGTVRAWGQGHNGNLGNGWHSDSTAPVVVSNLSNVARIGAAYKSGFAVHTDGSLSVWGANFFGQLGIGTTDDVATPYALSLPSGRRVGALPRDANTGPQIALTTVAT